MEESRKLWYVAVSNFIQLLNSICKAVALLDRMKVAEVGYKAAHEAFSSFQSSLPSDCDVATWKSAEEAAMSQRGESLRIFDIQLSKGLYHALSNVAYCLSFV